MFRVSALLLVSSCSVNCLLAPEQLRRPATWTGSAGRTVVRRWAEAGTDGTDGEDAPASSPPPPSGGFEFVSDDDEDLSWVPAPAPCECAPRGPALVSEERKIFQGETEEAKFSIKVRALRGDFSPPADEGARDVEGGTTLLESLAGFPARHCFTCTARLGGGGADAADELSAWAAATVARATGSLLLEDDVETKPRAGGKFVTVTLFAWTESAAMARDVLDALVEDARVLRAY